MACLAGTLGSPRTWFQQHRDGTIQRFEGRTCNRTADGTDPVKCGGCIAFRGRDAWGGLHTGLTADGQEWVALSQGERARFERASALALEEDDFSALEVWFRRQSGEPTDRRYLRTWIDDDDPLVREARDWWAEYMRTYRARHPEQTRETARRYATSERGRAKTRERVRRWRAARKAEGCNA